MMRVGDRGVFKVDAERSVYGRVLEVKKDEAIIEHFDGNLNRYLYHVSAIEFVNERQPKSKAA